MTEPHRDVEGSGRVGEPAGRGARVPAARAEWFVPALRLPGRVAGDLVIVLMYASGLVYIRALERWL